MAQVRFTHEQNMIETFTTNAPYQAFTDRVCTWCFDWRSQHLNPTCQATIRRGPRCALPKNLTFPPSLPHGTILPCLINDRTLLRRAPRAVWCHGRRRRRASDGGHRPTPLTRTRSYAGSAPAGYVPPACPAASVSSLLAWRGVQRQRQHAGDGASWHRPKPHPPATYRQRW